MQVYKMWYLPWSCQWAPQSAPAAACRSPPAAASWADLTWGSWRRWRWPWGCRPCCAWCPWPARDTWDTRDTMNTRGNRDTRDTSDMCGNVLNSTMSSSCQKSFEIFSVTWPVPVPFNDFLNRTFEFDKIIVGNLVSKSRHQYSVTNACLSETRQL